MLCQKCNANEANVHFTKIINGIKQEYYLCEKCMDLNKGMFKMLNVTSSLDFDMSNFLSGILDIELPEVETGSVDITCSTCGLSFLEFSKQGRLGCCDCYYAFGDRLLHSIRQIHGMAEHNGKVPVRIGKKTLQKREIQQLEGRLKVLIASQNFEEAAVIRDRIKELKEALG